MYNFYNSSVIYVSQLKGDDINNNGLAPEKDEFGNGPFKTIEKAVSSIGEMQVTGYIRPMTVSFVDDYFADKTIKLDCSKEVHQSELNINCVTFESFGERKKIIGGIQIKNWKKDKFNGVDCISAKLPEKADGSCWDFVDLFVDGKRATNTRFPATGYLKAVETESNYKTIGETPLFVPSKWFIAFKEDLKDVPGIEDATVNFYHYWVDEHTPVESYDYDTGKLVLKNPSRFTITTIYQPEEHTSALKYYLENIPTEFKNKNEWYFDRKDGIIYYIPDTENRDIENITAYAPTLNKIFEIYGTQNKKIHDIKFNNLEFLCTRSDYVSKYVKNPETGKYEYNADAEGGFASDIQSACYAHGALSFNYAQRCSVSECLIHHTGTYALEIKLGCSDIRIENNILEDLGAGGVRIFGGDSECDQNDITHNCIVRNNKILNCGKKLAAGCGVLLCHANSNEISGNEIAYLDYSGVSVGWVWGYNPNATYGNIITGNHIHHIGQGRLSDMGGIYLLGKQPGTVVSFNRIHDVSSAHYGGWGLYTDEGSSYITIENNVVYNTKCESFHQHYGSHNVVRNNIFAFGSAAVRVSKTEMHDCVLFENNIFITKNTAFYSNSRGNIGHINSRRNILFDISNENPLIFVDCNGNEYDLLKWNKCGKDSGSVIINPLFNDIDNYDFTISEISPAVALGFKPIKGFVASGK